MLWILLAICCTVRPALGQHSLELRGADSKYRYADWNFTFTHSAIVDLFYIGVPGSNEFNLGGGYGFKLAPSLLVVPLVYGVVAKEGDQRGVKVAVLVAFEKAGWKVNSFLAHFAPLVGEVSRYQVLDTLDVSKTVFRHWELGVSSGFFHADKKWNPQVGPLVKLNDRFGSWAVSYRFGPQKELRLTRVLILKK